MITTEKEQLYSLATELKLVSIKESLEEMIETSGKQGWSQIKFVCKLLDLEVNRRNENRKQQRIKSAHFFGLKYLEELERDELPIEDAQILPVLETLDFIEQGRNVVLYGNPGTGKTHMAIALGIKACMNGMTVLFTSVPKLLVEIREAKAQRKRLTMHSRFEKYDLVICDEFGYVGCDKEAGELFFNLLSGRSGNKATIITTNLAFNRWGEVIKDKVLVAALVDRITFKAHLVN
ncbi:MAG: IS21-like element helper ATPase IstB, partial [Phocaeicola sp.]